MSALLQRWVFGSQASRVQLSWSLHSVSLWQQPTIGWCTQPEDGSQKSCVQTSVSGGQRSGVPGAQLPPWQVSAGRQASPHGVLSAFVYWHWVAMHVPVWQGTLPWQSALVVQQPSMTPQRLSTQEVQTLLPGQSLGVRQQPAMAALTQPRTESQPSFVQGFPSSQAGG